MKKLFTLFLTLFVASSVWAYDFEVDGIYYYTISEISENEVGVTRGWYEDYYGDIVIPSSVTYGGNNYSVTSIGEDAFNNCSVLTSITIPNSVVSIGERAFKDCSGLTSITIPNSVISVGTDAFRYCSNLIIIYSGSAKGGPWGAKAVCGAIDENFYYKDAEKTIISKYIGNGGDVVIPNGVTSIEDYGFSDCSSLASITIPNSVTSIGVGAFIRCSGLTSVTMQNSVTSIGRSAFSSCYGLTSVTMPDGLDVSSADLSFTKDNIRYNVLNSKEISVVDNFDYYYDVRCGCYRLDDNKYTGDMVIPSSVTAGNTFSVTSIEGSAFSGCSGLTSITIPNSVTSIVAYAFNDCSGLTSITIPNSVTSIGVYAFSGCSGLTSITIPNSVTSIGEDAFNNCSGLTSITIPNSVTSIEGSAFSGCSGLTSITIPNSVTSIGTYAFNGCSGLTSITIPNSVTSIESGAFVRCSSLTTLIIKNSICSITGALYACKALKEYSGPATPFNQYNSSESGSFSTLLEKITFTSGTLDRNGLDYINLSYRTLQEIDLSGIENTEIPDMAFNNCYKLEKVTLPAQLESVGYKSFAGCTALEGISLPASVTKIDNSAFEDCRSMKKIVFDGSELKSSTSNLETIGKWAFYNCHNLQSLEIPEGVTSIGDAAFYGCTYLQDLKLPSTLKSMGDNTFALCENLKSMTILAEEPPSLYEKSFYNVDHTIPVSVPESSLKAYAETDYWSEFIHYKSADEQGGSQGGEQGGSTAVSEVSNATAVTIVNGQIFVNGEAPAFVVTVSGQKFANANLKAGVYFVVVDGESVGVSVR